ncbi:MAG TPA: M48 family metalloprotease [Acidobacteriaceae bacterium]|jgi:tetrahydromethanopterin S-methyltransferase subunit G|nr:M48 family metalloprotease [Acidobacteriaceae bacterium]
MPTPKISVRLLLCASLALAGGCLYAQSTSAPADGTPQQTSAPQAPDATPAQAPTLNPAAQQTPAASDQTTQNCPGPVLHRPADKGGDICSSGAPPANAPASDTGDEAPTTGARPLTDPNVNPFKQAEPDKDGNMPGVKGGSIEDVNAVGTRNIGARGMGNWYSTESEIKMGKQYADEIEKSTKFINDPVVTEYVNRIGQNIVKNSDCKVPFTIKVIDTDEINAMALPGGFFYVNSGLILAADEEAELAGVMAHETAHVCAHHAAREMTRANYAQIGMVPLIMMTGYSWTGYGIYEATQLLIPITFLEFSREFEAQADYLGVQYMYRAGYDPQAFVTFFEKVENLEKQKPGAVAKVFENHPQTPDRIQHTEEEIAKILPPKDEYLVTTSEFNDVKSRLARIENKRRIIDNKKGKPTLRRASTAPDGTTTNPGDNGSDQPTLHRRPDGNGNGGSSN